MPSGFFDFDGCLMSRVTRTAFLVGVSLSVAPVLAAGTGAKHERTQGRNAAPARMMLAQAPAAPVKPQEAAVPENPRFDIERFDVRGNTILDAAEVAAAVAPYTGKRKDFADVQRALEALQIRYQDRGFGTVQVTLPEQELESGVVVFRVIEPKLGKVVVEGNKFFGEGNIRRSVPSLKEGATPNVVDIGRHSRLANENPAKRTAVLLRAGENESQIDATIRVQDERPWRASVGLENTGSPTTGMWRLGFGFQHSNLFDRDHTLTVQYQLDPEPIDRLDDLKILGVGYRIPFYDRNASLDLLAGYSSVGSAATIANLPFNISGSGTIFGARYNMQMPRLAIWPGLEHKLTFGLDYKAFSNSGVGTVDPATGSTRALQPDVTVHPFSVTYSGGHTFDNAQIGFYGSVAHNFHPHGSDAFAAKFNSLVPEVENGPLGSRPGAGRPTFTVWRYGFNYARGFANDMQFRANFTGQWTRDALIPGEQFGLGGWDNLRGMRERETSMDRGRRASLELYSPDFSAAMSIPKGRLRALAFFDWGQLSQNFKHMPTATTCDPNQCRFSAASIGVGLRMSIDPRINLRADFAQLIDPGLIGNRNTGRVHVGMTVGF